MHVTDRGRGQRSARDRRWNCRSPCPGGDAPPCLRLRSCRRWRASSRRPPSAAERSAVRPARPPGACCRRPSTGRFPRRCGRRSPRPWDGCVRSFPAACSAQRAMRRRAPSLRSLSANPLRFFADPEPLGHVLDHVAVAVGVLADREEIGVGGDLERFDQRQGAVVGLAGVAELLFARFDARSASQRLLRGDHSGFQRTHRRDRLERRAGRIVTFDGSIEQRAAGRGLRFRRCR